MSVGTVAEVVGVILVLACGLVCWLAFRRLRLIRAGGVDVALRRRPAATARGWQLGVGRYVGDHFAWYRLASVRPGPDVLLERSELDITDRRAPSGAEGPGMPSSSTVLSCRGADGPLELAMPTDVLTGFLSWLEASPPGRITGHRQAS